MQNSYHVPVMLQESIEGLNIIPNGVYVDVTFGGGGHSREILKSLNENGRLIAFDRDPEALVNMPDDSRFTLVPADFIHLRNYLREMQVLPVDGILADLGISSHQIDAGERGFSFRFNAALDMRMDKQNPVTAAQIVNEESQDGLQRIFSAYGEIKNARTLAEALVSQRKISPIETTGELANTAEKVMPRKENFHKYLATVFQALRIAVNNELEGLKEFLLQALSSLNTGGRLVVMSYHSLEDRLVKNFFQTGNFEGFVEKDVFGKLISPWRIINRKPMTPSEEEILRNSRSRSAKLRIVEKI